MWFWINFSPIGQAPPSPKKPVDAVAGKEPEPKIEGKRCSSPTRSISTSLFFLAEGKQLAEHVGEVSVREPVRRSISERQSVSNAVAFLERLFWSSSSSSLQEKQERCTGQRF